MNQSPFKTTYSRLRKFVKRLQKSDDATKKRWFIGGSVISMIFVITLWLLSLQINTPTLVAKEELQKLKATAKTEETQSSMLDTFENGIYNIAEDLKTKYETFKEQLGNNFSSLKSKIEKTNDISIENTEVKFEPQHLEQIPPTPLP